MTAILRALILLITTLNPLIGTVLAGQELDDANLPKTVEEPEYRPWEINSTSRPWLSLEGMGITTFGHLFRSNVCNLKWLVMDDNSIRMIPSETFKYLPALSYLSLAKNSINVLQPGAFSFLYNLQVLDLDDNYLQNSITDTSIFDSLTALKTLYLRSNKLTSFHLSKPMESLTHFYLSDNALRTFYAQSESPLTHLYLDDNLLTFVSLANFTSLIYLNVSGNSLHNIRVHSKEFGEHYAQNIYRYRAEQLALYLEDSFNLRHLIASHNQLTDIESDVFVGTEWLVHVDLSNNKISQIDAGTFNDLLELESVLLDSNRIKRINYRAFANLPKVKTISLKNNRIKNIDEDAFTKLNSTANEIHLFLDNNNIHTLNKSSVANIKGLKHIGLSGNRIKTIAFNAFANLPNLESLVIEHQFLGFAEDFTPWDPETRAPSVIRGSIDTRAFFNLPNLTSIIIRGNVFTDIAAEAFHALPKLRDLDLSNNTIEYLSPEAFSQLPELDILKLGQNRLAKTEPGTFPEQLRILDLAENYPCPNLSCWNIGGLNVSLKQLNISGTVEQFTIKDLETLPKDLAIVI